MKILAKLLTAFLAVALLCGVVGVVGIVQLENTSASLTMLTDRTIPTLDLLRSINAEVLKIKVATRSIAHPMGLDDPVYLKRHRDNIATARAAYGKMIEQFEALEKTSEELRLWETVKGLIPATKEYNDLILAVAEKAELNPADRDRYSAQLYELIAGEKRLVFDEFIAAIDKIIAYDSAYYGNELPTEAKNGAKLGITAVLFVTGLAFLTAVALGIILGRSISASLRKAVSALDRIAAGDTSERFTVSSKDEFKQVAAALDTVADTINGLVSEMLTLTEAAVDGKLTTRGDAAKFKGGYRGIVEGVNQTLEAVIVPLNVAAVCIDRIAKGDIPPKIEETYNGDFNLIKNNLNACIAAVNALVADTGMLAQAAVEGRLSARAEAAQHHGDFRKIVDGVNKTLDLVVDPVNELIAILKRMAEGDMTASMDGTYRGDFDVLKTALNDTIDSINEILAQVTQAVEQVTAGSQQVSQASQALSQGATEQASSLEEITSSVTEIASQTRQNTENAVQVNSLSKAAKTSAEQGDGQMKDLVSAMSDINRSAEEIRKIVKAIDDISFQINLLALNANVEAARAGKYGKGFAVVAEEVRNLAVRSAASVKETTVMVDEAIANIGVGNKLVDVTAKQLAAIVTGSAQVAGLAEEVSTASREQTQGLEQITTGLNQIDQVTQSNTASAEESASAAEELSSQAQQLKGMIAKFVLKQRESRMTDTQMLEILRAEMASRGGPQAATAHRAAPAAPKAPVPRPASARTIALRPADVVSLDDDDFGKF